MNQAPHPHEALRISMTALARKDRQAPKKGWPTPKLSPAGKKARQMVKDGETDCDTITAASGLGRRAVQALLRGARIEAAS